jgi:hypothetical protein
VATSKKATGKKGQRGKRKGSSPRDLRVTKDSAVVGGVKRGRTIT